MTRQFFAAIFCLVASFAVSAADSAPPESNPESPMGDYLDCTAFTWMQNCKKVNDWIAQHPDQPLRLKKNGLEFYFPPGTPSPTVDWVVNQTPDALKRYMAYLVREHQYAEKSASMYRAALEQMGGTLPGIPGVQAIRHEKPYLSTVTFDQDKVAVYMFLDSRCPACKVMYDRIAEIHKAFPKMFMSLLQFDGDYDAAARLQRYTGVKVSVMNEQQRQMYAKRVPEIPTIWINDKASRKTSVLIGPQTVPDIVRALERMSK